MTRSAAFPPAARSGGRAPAPSRQLHATGLRCEYVTEPLGVDRGRPVFSWTPETDGSPAEQTAYRLLVASAAELLEVGTGDRWDSGVVSSDQIAGIAYDGAPLGSRERLWWSVTLWDGAGTAGPAATSWFEMGLLDAQEWLGTWIGGPPTASAPILRTEFDAPDDVIAARLYVSGLGHHEVQLNGRRVGDRLLDPATTTYAHDPELRGEDGRPTRITRARVPYVVHDVTHLVHAGANAVGLVLGHGWYSAEDDVEPMPFGRSTYGDSPRALLQLELATAGGERVVVTTGPRWRTSAGPITYNDHFHGERHDARAEAAGWDRAGFDDATWSAATPCDAPDGELRSQLLEPVRVIESIPPAAVDDRGDGRRIIDFGQHLSGWTQLEVAGPAGATVTLRHAGAIGPDGELDHSANMLWRSKARQTDAYTLRGDGAEVWEPRFTLHGFRYVEVLAEPGVEVRTTTARVAHSDIESVGRFECDDDLLNAIHDNVRWTFRASFQGVPQDAAERAERVAWLGDPGWVIEDYLCDFGSVAFWSKWLDDLADVQLPNGNLPMVAPIHWRGPLPDALPHVSDLPYAVWPDFTTATYPLIAWNLYRSCGDRSVLDRHLGGMARAVDWMRSKARQHIIHEGFGDHMEPQPDGTCSLEAQRTPVDLTSTAWYFAVVVVMADAAAVVGDAESARRYRRLAADIRQAFNDRYLDREAACYATGSQTSLAMPLWLGLAPDDLRAAVGENLVRAVEAADWHLATGTMGTAALEHALPAIGAADVMLRIARQTTYPSWGDQIRRGATTIWETWGGDADRSLNMKLLTSIESFLYRDVAGLGPAAPGWARIVVAPKVTSELGTAAASVRTPRGVAAVAWRRDGDELEIDVDVPATSVAEVVLPRGASTDDDTPLPGGHHEVRLRLPSAG